MLNLKGEIGVSGSTRNYRKLCSDTVSLIHQVFTEYLILRLKCLQRADLRYSILQWVQCKYCQANCCKQLEWGEGTVLLCCCVCSCQAPDAAPSAVRLWERAGTCAAAAAAGPVGFVILSSVYAQKTQPVPPWVCRRRCHLCVGLVQATALRWEQRGSAQLTLSSLGVWDMMHFS